MLDFLSFIKFLFLISLITFSISVFFSERFLNVFFSVFKNFLMSGNVFNFQELFLFLIIPSSLHPFLIFMTAVFALRILFRGGCLLFLSF